MKQLLALVALLLAVVPVVHAETPLDIYSITDIDITTTRSDYDYGWVILGVTSDTAYNIYGKTNDSADVFIPDSYVGAENLSVVVKGIAQTPKITAGDTVTFTYTTESGGGELDIVVRMPAVAVDLYRLYVSTTGATFSDDSCATRVSGATPTPAPTATAALPTSTPTAIPPTPTPTPAPDTAYLYLIPTASSPGLIGSMWMDTDGVLWFNHTGADVQVSP